MRGLSIRTLAFLFAAPAASGQETLSPAARVAEALDTSLMWTHLRVLADDSMEGRGPGTRGGAAAARYIAAQFAGMGLEPAGDSGTFFHSFPMAVTRIVRSTLAAGQDTLAFGIDQVLTVTESTAEAEAGGPAVFVGFGIVAPEQQWDDSDHSGPGRRSRSWYQ